MEPLTAVIGIVAVFLVIVMWIARTEQLSFLAPGSSHALSASARTFCRDRCRVDGHCPLTQTAERAANCPLYGYVAADVATVIHGSPFERDGNLEESTHGHGS